MNDRDRNHSRDKDPRPRVEPSPNNGPPRSSQDKTQRAPNAREGEIEHIRDTGLPPGIRVDEVKDPGSQPPHAPTDDRS